METKLTKCLLYVGDGDGLIFLQRQCAGVEVFLRDHQLCQSLGIGHDVAHGSESRQHLGAQNLAGSITLGILHGTPITGREEQHLIGTHQLGEIVIEITCLLSILKHKKHLCLTLGSQTGKHHRGG